MLSDLQSCQHECIFSQAFLELVLKLAKEAERLANKQCFDAQVGSQWAPSRYFNPAFRSLEPFRRATFRG
jgi:hypothetical protein